MLKEIISKQVSCLQILDLNLIQFSQQSFDILVTMIAECGVCSTLKELNFKESANFDYDSKKKFAGILATAPVL